MLRCINRNTRAFTLLETLFALGLAGALLSGIYAIASGTIQLTSEISRDRDRQLTEQSFLTLCRSTLRGLPAAADLKLRVARSGTVFLSEIVVSGDPTAFGFSSVPPGATAVVLSSRPGSGDSLAVNLRYLDEQQIADFDRGVRNVGKELHLLSGVRQFDWRFFDRRGNRWKTEWDIRSGRPAMIELTLAIGRHESTRHVFWIPDLKSPPLPIPRPVQEKPIDDDI